MIDRNQIRKQIQHLRICDWAATLICVVSIALVLFAPQISKSYYLVPVGVAVGGFQWYRVIKNDDLKVAAPVRTAISGFRLGGCCGRT